MAAAPWKGAAVVALCRRRRLAGGVWRGRPGVAALVGGGGRAGEVYLEGRGRRSGAKYGRRPAAQMVATAAADSGGAALVAWGGGGLVGEDQ